jgi:hypothetical protein
LIEDQNVRSQTGEVYFSIFLKDGSHEADFSRCSEYVLNYLSSSGVNLDSSRSLRCKRIDESFGQVHNQFTELRLCIYKLKIGVSSGWYSNKELSFLVEFEIVSISE